MTDGTTDPLPRILTTGSLNLLGGGSGVGKTALLAWMATCFRDGIPIFGHPVNPVPAIGYIAADRPWADSRLWFEAVGFPEIHYYSMVDDRQFNTARLQGAKPKIHAEIFEEFVNNLQMPPGSLLFVDPIALFLGGDLNHYIRMAIGCVNLYRVVLARQLCVVGIVHSGKQKGEKDRYVRLQDRLSGSMAQLGHTGTQMYLAGPEEMDSPYHTFHWNPHHAPPDTFQIEQDRTTGLFKPVGDDVAAGPPLVLSDEVLGFLGGLPPPGTPVNTPGLLQLFIDSMDRATIFRRVRLCVASGHLRKLKHGVYERTGLEGAKGEETA